MEQIYFDHSATTPVDPEVLAEMMRFFANHFGNPSSSHGFGRRARESVDLARQRVAALIGADPAEIVFTSGGTEADNLAILGTALAAGDGRNHIVASAIEHHAVLNACRHLEARGFRTTFLPVDGQGLVEPAAVAQAVTGETLLVSIMHANNEIGTVEPIAELAYIAREKGALFHTDAVQSVGKIPVQVNVLGVDLLSLAGHKLYGPKGVGALYVRQGTPIRPLFHGGGQEGGLRNGTENVPGIVGLGKACEVAGRTLAGQMDALNGLRSEMETRLRALLGDLQVNGHVFRRLPHVLSVSFPGVAADVLVRDLDLMGIAVSAGAACTVDRVIVSHVLSALALPREAGRGTVRLSFGKGNTPAQVDHAAGVIAALVTKHRQLADREEGPGGRGRR